MAGRAGRRGQLVLPEERAVFLEGLEKWNDVSSRSSAEETEERPKQQRTSRKSSSAAVPEYPDEGCRLCGKDDDHKNLMFCDKCQGQYHFYCLNPPLMAVPTGNWFCINCKPHKAPEQRIDDGLHEMVCALPPTYTERFGEIVWAQGGVGFGWWPSFIYDPRLTVGSARELARKHLGRKHLVFFLECLMAPFSVLGEAKLVKWEKGLAEDYHLGKAAHAHSKARGMTFRQALHIACLEEGKPIGNRMAWNHVVDDVPLDEHVPMSPVKIKRKRELAPKEQPEKDQDVPGNAKRRRSSKRGATAKKEPSTLGSASRTNLLHAVALHNTPAKLKTPSTCYCRVFKRESDDSDDEFDVRMGFITLASKDSTFLDARVSIQADMDPDSLPGETWKFYLPSLGTVSNRQEKRLGPVASFLQRTFGGQLGDGSVKNPFHLVLVGVNRSA